MKQLTCEMCGSTDLLKQEGVFVCQTCGTKYSVEEAKKMMIEGTVQVEGTVTIKDSGFVIKAGVLEEYNGELTKVVIPDSVKNIAEKCFKRLPIEEVIMPNSITTIGKYAFEDCKSLKSVKMSDNITEIHDGAFRCCGNIVSITIPSKTRIIGKDAFAACSNIKNIQIPNTVVSIGDSAFSLCTGLTSIKIPSSVTSIGDGAFSICTGLTSITMPSSVKEVGDQVFYGCKNLDPTKVTCESYAIMGRKETFGYCGFVEKGYCENCASVLEKKLFGRYVCPRCGKKY